MNPIHPFQWLVTFLDVTLLGAIGQVAANLITSARTAAIAAGIAYLGWTALMLVTSGNTDGPLVLMRRMGVIAIVIGYGLTFDYYNRWANEFLLGQLAQGLSSAAAGGNAVTGNSFDILLGKLVAACVTTLKAVGVSPTTWVLIPLALMYGFTGALIIAATFCIWVLPHELLGLLIAAGPPFVACALAPESRWLAIGWLRVCLNQVAVQFLIGLAVAVLITAFTQTQQQVVAAADVGISATQSDIARTMAVMFGTSVIGMVVLAFVWKIPFLAATITGSTPVGFMSDITAAVKAGLGQLPRGAGRSGGDAPGSVVPSTGMSSAQSYATAYQAPGPAIHRRST